VSDYEQEQDIVKVLNKRINFPSPELAIASKLFRTILKLLFEEVVIEILVIAILIKQMNIKKKEFGIYKFKINRQLMKAKKKYYLIFICFISIA